MPALSSFQVELPWPDTLVPEYRVFALGRWRMRKTPPMPYVYGYWIPTSNMPEGYALQRKHHGKWSTWMSLTPMELQAHQPHIAAAYGNVIVGGLGMGVYLFNILRKPEVERVLVVEQDQTVIDLFHRSTDWRSWPGAEKLEIRHGDILTLKQGAEQDTKVDVLYLDIWERLGEDIAWVQTQTAAKNLKPDWVGYWGQEFDFATFLSQNDYTLAQANKKSFAEFAGMVGMPLVGMDDDLYPRFAVAAVALQASGKFKKSGDEIKANALLMASLDLIGAFSEIRKATALETAA